MNKPRLDITNKTELIKRIQTFLLNETKLELNEIQAASLLDSILTDVSGTLYTQALHQSRYEILHQLEEILGIEKQPLQ